MCIRDRFICLYSVISSDATVIKDLDNHLSKASSFFRRLPKRVWQSKWQRRYRCTEPLSFPSSCMVQRSGFWIGSRLGYLSNFCNTACAPSLASKGKTTCPTKTSSRQSACPAKSLSCFRSSAMDCHIAIMVDTCACPEQSSSESSKKESMILVLQESVTKTS